MNKLMILLFGIFLCSIGFAFIIIYWNLSYFGFKFGEILWLMLDKFFCIVCGIGLIFYVKKR
ncbi:MAG: hypothetical protein IJ475_02180 [Bacilli bacterium]|nr:hypothetical protein [Bacilli bacterium]